MRTNQVSQTIALAIGLVSAMGFLGYTMLGPRSTAAATPQPLRQVAIARPATAPATREAPPPVVVIARPEPIKLTPEQARFIETGSLQGVARPTDVSPATAMAPPVAYQPAAKPATQEVRNEPPVAKTPAAPAIPLPPAPVLTLPAPVAPPAHAISAAPAAPQKRKPLARQSALRVNVPDAAPTQAAAAPQWEEVKSAAPAVVEKLPPVVAAAPVTQPTHKGATSAGISTPFSKDEMTVTISGDKAWVQVSPTQTMAARKGDVLPNLGKILEIKNNQVVAEKGILNTH